MPDQVDVDFLSKFKKIIVDFTKKGHRVILICGGGNTCRKYQHATKQVNPSISSTALDWLGIAVTQINAIMVKNMFGNLAEDGILADPTKKIATRKRIIIGCGWKPGCSSDRDAVLAAKTFNVSTVINLSNITYVYDKDPNHFKDAKPMEKMNWHDFRKIVGNIWHPGAHVPFDPVASKLAQKNGLKLVVMKGSNLTNLRKYLTGEKFQGTVISD